MLIHERFVFIHLQKTGGTFLAKALKQEMPAGSLVRGAKGTLHPGWDDIPDYARDRPVLAYVRNPWDWYVSWYHYVMSQAPGDSAVYRVLFGNGRNDFTTSLRNACAGLVEPGRPETVRLVGRGDDFYSTRVRRFCAAGFDSEQLTVGRFESLVDDLERFLAMAGAPLDPGAIARIRAGKPLKVTPHRPYHEYYDDELRELVARSCSSLIERFGYTFRSSR